MLAPETRGMSQPFETMWMKAGDWLREKKRKTSSDPLSEPISGGHRCCRLNSGIGQMAQSCSVLSRLHVSKRKTNKIKKKRKQKL